MKSGEGQESSLGWIFIFETLDKQMQWGGGSQAGMGWGKGLSVSRHWQRVGPGRPRAPCALPEVEGSCLVSHRCTLQPKQAGPFLQEWLLESFVPLILGSVVTEGWYLGCESSARAAMSYSSQRLLSVLPSAFLGGIFSLRCGFCSVLPFTSSSGLLQSVCEAPHWHRCKSAQ